MSCKSYSILICFTQHSWTLLLPFNDFIVLNVFSCRPSCTTLLLYTNVRYSCVRLI